MTENNQNANDQLFAIGVGSVIFILALLLSFFLALCSPWLSVLAIAGIIYWGCRYKGEKTEKIMIFALAGIVLFSMLFTIILLPDAIGDFGSSGSVDYRTGQQKEFDKFWGNK